MTKPMRKAKPPALRQKNGLPDWSELTGEARRRAIKAYFDTLSPEAEAQQLAKLSGADLHNLICATVAERPEGAA